MEWRELTPDLFVSGQLTAADIADAASRGIRTIICNRPEGESPDQPSTMTLQQAAERAGIRFHHVPVVGGAITEADVEAFDEARRESGKPVLAFCRSGARSTCLWALTEASSTSAEELIEKAARAGFDIAGLRPALEARG